MICRVFQYNFGLFLLTFISFYKQLLIDPVVRGAALKNVDLSKSIVILDESAGAPNVCKGGAAKPIASADIISALEETKFVSFLSDMPKGFVHKNTIKVISFLTFTDCHR